MAGEHTESEAHGEGTNGVSKSGAGSFASARAAFLAGESGVEAKAESKPVAHEESDDADLDEDAEKDVSADDDEREVSDSDEDPDADLDEDEDDEESDEKDEDAEKGVDKVRRTEKRMREQIKKERAEAEAELRDRAQQVERELEQKWGAKIAAAERFEKIAARASVDPVAALEALGVKESAYEHIAQVLYTIAKAKDDPKAKAAAANLMKARERDAELDDLKKKFEEREKADKERAEQAAADREVEAFMGSVTKAVGDKTPLAKALLKNDAATAREELQVVAFKLAKELGKLPDARAVAIAFEKAQRAKLRALGIDPKSRGAAAAIVADSKSETAAKSAAKQGDKKPTAPKPDEKKLSPREAFIRKPD